MLSPLLLALVPLAPGFEEIEAVTIIDVLRRAEIQVRVVGLEPGPVTGSHGITLETDGALSDVKAEDVRVAILPGGLPGAENLKGDSRLLELLAALHSSGRTVAAICAAPMVLGAAGVLTGAEATCYPGFEEHLTGATHTTNRVQRSGNVVTSRGPGTALEFALALVADWKGAAVAEELSRGMLVQG